MNGSYTVIYIPKHFNELVEKVGRIMHRNGIPGMVDRDGTVIRSAVVQMLFRLYAEAYNIPVPINYSRVRKGRRK